MTEVRGGVAEFEPLIRYHTFEDPSVSFTAAYGAIGGATVTMLWIHLSRLAILIGAELNGAFEASWRSRPTSASASRCRAGGRVQTDYGAWTCR